MTVEELINLVKTENPYTFGYTPKKNPYITKGEITYIGLSQNKYTTIDTEDLTKVENYRWYAKFSRPKNWYATNSKRINSRSCLSRLQSLIFPEYGLIDHINIDGLDNRKENLRKTTTALNNYNINPRSPTGFLGVNAYGGKYNARVSVKRKLVHLGAFDTPEEAAKVVNEFRNKLIQQLEEELAQNTPSCPRHLLTP